MAESVPIEFSKDKEMKDRLIQEIFDLQNRLEALLTVFYELKEATLEEEDEYNRILNQEVKSMDKDISDLDEKGKSLSKDGEILIGQIIVSFEEFSHAITETPDSIDELFKQLYQLLNELLFTLQPSG